MLFSCVRYNGPNLVLKYDRTQNKLVNIAVDDLSSPYYALRDPRGNAIGLSACDVDGDGREEIYFLNTNNAYSGTQRNACDKYIRKTERTLTKPRSLKVGRLTLTNCSNSVTVASRICSAMTSTCAEEWPIKWRDAPWLALTER